jgi:hypothetical protein
MNNILALINFQILLLSKESDLVRHEHILKCMQDQKRAVMYIQIHAGKEGPYLSGQFSLG